MADVDGSDRASTPRLRLIGMPTDRNSSFLRGPAGAPGHIRAALGSDAGNPAAGSGVELGVDVIVEDAGDLDLREEDADDDRIEAAVRAAARAGACPLSLGGDHAVTFPILRGLAGELGAVDILHFDAHPDLYHDFRGNPRSHASPFARIMEAGLARRLVQVGIRTLNAHQRDQARRFGVEIIGMEDFSPAAVPILEGPLYVSIDLDGLDPSAAPGVSHPEPGGLTVREVLAVLQRQRAPLAGADVVELNPDRDLNGLTATVAAKLVKELAGYLVQRRAPAR